MARTEPVLVDRNVLLDLAGHDSRWIDWSAAAILRFANEGLLVINPIIYAEIFVGFAAPGGAPASPLPDFYIGAHAAVRRYRLPTRASARYRTSFPTVELIAP